MGAGEATVASELADAWARVLVRLDVRSIASAAAAGRLLHGAAASALRALAADVSGGQEPRPIACVNTRDSELAPRGYLYRRSCQLPDGRVPVTLRSAHGCTCAGLSQAASASHCSAMAERHCSCAGAYTADGRLLELTQSGNECTGAVHECGPVCNCCAQTCSARVSQ
eukprot:jgi/Tetstr1/446509/TSEL_034037.t1